MTITSYSGLSGLPSLFLFDTEIKNQATPIANTAKDPQVKADVAYFTSQLAKLKTPDDFLNNPKLVNFVLTAVGLQSESTAMGIVRQVLTQDPTSKTALANQLADPRWQKLANAIDFFHRGVAGLQSYTSTTSLKVQSGTVTLTLNTSPNFKIGQAVTFADAANPHQNFMAGTVTKINGSSVTISVPSGIGAVGSGTISNWNVHANNIKSGGTTTPPNQVVQDLIQQYTTAQFENGLGQQSTPVEEAAYFLRNAGSVTSTYQLLGDRVMLDVIEGALGIPKAIAKQPVDDQKRLIESQLDIKTLQNPNAAALTSGAADDTTLQGINQVTSAAQAAMKNVVGQIQSVMQQYSFLPGRTDPAGPNAATVAIQQASVPALVDASGLIGAANSALNSVTSAMNTLKSLASSAATADAATLAADKTTFQQLTQQIKDTIGNATYTDPATGTVNNFLTDGSLSFSATVKAGETITFNGVGLDAATLGSQLDAANAAFQSTAQGGPVDPNVSSNLTTASGTLSTTQTQVTAQQKNYNQAVQDSGTFLAALNSGSLNTGLAAGQDAQSRTITISGYIQQLQSLATQSADPTFAGDRNALNTSAAALITKINTAIATPGSGIADNLLTGSKSYALIGGNSVTIRGEGLDQSIGNNLAGADISSQAGAQALSDLISGTLQPAIKQAQLQMSTDVNAVKTAVTTFDPRGAIDSQLKQLVSQLSNIEASAGVNGQNLISTSAKSIGVTLKSTNDTFTIHAHSDFDSLVGGALRQALAALATSDSPPTAFLQQAFGAATTIQSAINRDVATLAPDQARVAALVAQQAKINAANQTNPYAGASQGAQKLVQKYLALQDANNNSNSANSYLVTLLGAATQQGTTPSIDFSTLNFKT